jgi:hypothetical protein
MPIHKIFLGTDRIGERPVVKPVGVGGGAEDHIARALEARPFISEKRGRDIVGPALETTGEDEPVLDRHHRTLCQHRQSRVARIAEQRHRAHGPPFHRLAHHQGPFEE